MESRTISDSIRRFAIWMPALVAGFFVVAALAPAMAGAAYFNVSPDDPADCIWIRDYLPSTEIAITIDDPGTVPTDDYVFARMTDPSGNYNFDSEPRPDFSVGWQITVSDGVSSVTHTVLNVGIADFDVAEDGCWGWSQVPNSTVNVGFWCDYLGTYIDRVVPTDGFGNWLVDFTLPVGDGLGPNQGADFKITDTATVTQGDGGGGATQTNGRPFNPMICVYPNDDIVDGWQWTPATNVTINIDRGGAGGGFEYSETVQADEGGNLRIDASGAFDILPGDVVSATDGTWSTETTVTAVQITTVNVEIDYIWGTAEPGSWVSINVFTGTALEVQADINGDWAVSAGFDMIVGADLQAFQNDEDMDRTQVNWHVSNPRIGADPVHEQISGWEWGNGTALMVWLDGNLVGTPTCDENGNFNVTVPPAYDIVEGSVVSISGGSIPKSTIVTGLTITELNDGLDTVSGTAEAGSFVHVWVYNGGHRLVQADGGGFWTAYFAIPAEGEQVCTVDPGSSGNANQEDEDFDQTQIQWHLANPSFGVDPDTGDVWGGDWTDPVLNLSVDDPGTGESPDFQTTINTGGMYWGTNLNGQFDIEPGHVVRIWDSMNDKQHTVAALSLAEIDLDGNTVTGTGPEGQWVIVSVGNWAASRTVQVSGGYWVADFSVAGEGENTFDIVPGTPGEVHWNDPDNDTTRLMWHALNPHFGADPAREEIWGNDFAPLASVTITVDDGGDGYMWTAETDEQGNFGIGFMGEYDLAPGHIVTVTDGVTTKIHTVIDLVVTNIDPNLETVSGIAQADRYVGVDVYEQASREVMADTSGNWTADFATAGEWQATADIGLGTEGEARQGDDDSDYTRAQWRLANPQFGVDPEREEVFGSDFARFVEVIVTIDDGAGGYQTTAWTDEWGNFSTGPLGDFDLQVGHVVTVDDGTQLRDHTVRYLTVDSIDAEADTVSGSADPAVEVQVDAYGMAWRAVDSDGSGAWTADFMNPGNGDGFADIGLGTEGEARRHDEDGDFTRAMWRIPNPHFGVDPGREEIWGNDFAPLTTVTIAIDDPGVIGPVDWQTTTETDEQGNFGIGFMGEYDLAPGHIVTVTDGVTIKNHTVIDLVVTNIDPDLETVSGTAEADRYVGVDVYEQASREVMADTSGNWTADFSVGQDWEGLADIQPGSNGEARQGDDDSDYTRASWHVLNVQVGVDPGRWEEIWGTDFGPWGEVTITIDDPGTTLSPDYETTTGTDDMGNFGVSLEWEFDIQPGYVVVVTDGITTHVHEVIDLVVADIDIVNETVSGTGAPGGWVDVDVYGVASRGTEVDEFGNWSVNFAVGQPWEGTADLDKGTEGEVRQHDEDWDYTRTAWHVLNPRFTVNPETQEIYGNDFAPSTMVTIMIDDPGVGGPIDWQTTVETDAWGDFGSWFWGEFELLPDHVVTVTDGVTTKVHTVLNVQVTDIDPVAETVTGTADPFAWVQVNVWDSGASKQVQADEFGNWTADFSFGEEWEFADIMLGSEGSAQRWDEDSDATEDTWRLANPAISLRPWDDNFGIYDFPRNAGVTLEIDDPGIPGAPDFTRELTTDDWGNVEEWLDPAVFDLAAGQIVTVTSGEIVKSHTITSLSITSIDPDTDTMTGTSDPAFPVVAYNWWYEGEWYPVADESGNWTLTDMPLDPMNEGSVAQWDEDGDSTDGGWRVLAPRMEVNPDQECVRLYDWPQGADVNVEIDDPEIPGDPNYSALVSADPWGNLELWLDPAQFDIHAGQTITATFGEIVKTHTVTSLSITTAQEGMLTGTGDFGTEVNFSDWQGWWMGQRNVWPDESGNWTLLDEQLAKGGSGDASQWDNDWDYTRVEWHILNPAFAVDLTYRNMDGWDWLPSADLAISIDHPATVPNPDHAYSHVTDESGNFWFDADGAGLDVVPGDIMTVTDGQTLKTHEVFDVAVTSADPDTDIVAGTFAPDAWLSVSAWTPFDGQDREVQCDGAGDWSIDFKTSWMGNPPLDLVPGSDAQAWVGDDDGDVTRSTWHIPDPRFRASPMFEEIYGEEWPADTPLLITYDDPTTGLSPDVTTSTVTSPIGDFQIYLGAAGMDIKTGDIVTVTDGETLKEHIVLPVSVSGVNPDDDTVWGTAAPNSMVWLSIDDPEYWGGVEVETDASGNWTANFSFMGMGSWDIVPDTTGNVNQSDDDNDETWVSWSAGSPRFTVAPNSDSVWGVDWENSGEVSISIDDPHNGLSVDWQDVIATSEWLGEFWIETTGYDVLPGDIVTVTDGSSTKTHTVTALTVAGADIDTNVLYGATDSNETVRVGYFPDGWWGPALVEVQPDLTWTYDFDLNDPPLDLQLGDEAAADQVDADGDSTWVDWSILTPASIGDEGTTDEDTTLVIDAPGLLGNDVYNPGETAIAVDTTPLHGDLTVDADTGAWTYVPDANWAGSDSFTYVLIQGTYESAPAMVTITVEPVNDAPVANADADVTPENTVLNVAAPGVLANDTDVEDDPLTAIKVTDPAHGTVTLNANGSYTYSPDLEYSGVDSFTYKANDGQADSNIVTVTIYVTSVNVPPTAVSDTATTPEDTPLTVVAPGVLGNDDDVNGDPIMAIKVTDPAHGTVTLNANGSYTYTPAANYFGPDSFTYKANDGMADSNTVTVSITVTPVNDAPVAVADGTWTVTQDTVLNRAAPGVLANDSDIEGSALTASLVTGVSHGELALSANGSFIYTPTPGYIGADSFTYRAYDGAAYSSAVTVSIYVNPVELVEVPIQGATRFATSVAVSQQAFPEGSDWVVIATGRNWPDALGGSALAGALGGPILLTDTTVMPTDVVAEIERLGATNAIILGGTTAVAPGVETALNTLLGDANVERIGEGSRYLTADAVAARTIQELGAEYDGTAFMATGTNYPDALAAAPLAAGLHWPLYLTRPTGITPETYAAMDGVTEVLVLGGTGAVPAMIETSLVARYGDANVTRLSGNSRYETAVAVATYGVNHGLGWNMLALATGEKFPDALAGGILQGLDGSVMLLTKSNSLDPAVAAVLTAQSTEIREVRYLGGTGAISQAVRDAVANILD